jgi:hypothetical protein
VEFETSPLGLQEARRQQRAALGRFFAVCGTTASGFTIDHSSSETGIFRRSRFARKESKNATPMKPLISLMRGLHLFLGISAPDPKHEKWFALAWIGILLAIIAATVFFTAFIVPYVMK